AVPAWDFEASYRIGEDQVRARCSAGFRPGLCQQRVDAVEKGFFSSDRARLIQDQAPERKVDSRNRFSRFDCCIFLFHSFRAVTFSTASVMTGRTRYEHIESALPPIAAEKRTSREVRVVPPLADVSKCSNIRCRKLGHSITSSACASRDAGTAMRSDLAVCKLRTNSNLLAWMTGSMPGLSPLRTRPT